MNWLTRDWEITIQMNGLWLALVIVLGVLLIAGPPIVINAIWTWRFRHTRRATADFGRMVDCLPSGVVSVTPTGEISLINARARELWPGLRLGGPLPIELGRLIGPNRSVTSSTVRGPSGVQLAARGHSLLTRRGGELILILDDASRLQQEAEFSATLVRQISHELKTPLSVIRGHASRFAADGQSDPYETRRAWAVVDDEASRLTALIDQAILMARLETPEPLLERRPINLRAVCEDVVIDLAERMALDGVELDLEAEDGDYVLQGDRAALRQVLLNLVDNAVKYGGADVHIVIALSTEPDTSHVRLAVRDDGHGIPTADLPHVFEKGYRGFGSRGSRAGSGFGLALVRSIVQWHGGTVRIDSEPGQGASVVIVLPRTVEALAS